MSLPTSRSGASVPRDIDRTRLAMISGRNLASPIVGSAPIGLNAASDSLCGSLPGVFHKHEIQLQLGNFVIADRRMPIRCPCCGKDSQLYCPTCVWNTFFQQQNFAKRREGLNRRKAELSIELKNLLEQQACDQTQLFQKQRRIGTLKDLISEKRANIERLKETKEKKKSELARTQKHVEALKKKAQAHHKRIEDYKKTEERLEADLNRLKLRRHQYLIQHFRELMALFPMIESAPQRIGDDEPSLKIVQMIEDAAFLDKARYSEVAKRQTVPKIYYKVRGCLVPGMSDYAELLNELSDRRSLTTRASKETIAGLGFTAQFVNSLSFLFDVHVPFRVHIDDLLTCENWTKSLLLTDVFCLNLSVVLICMHAGVETKHLDLRKPFNNFKLLNEIMAKKSPSSICFFDNKQDKLHNQILNELQNLSTTWEESPETGFDVNEVEEDWVSVTKTK
uniref:Beclin 1-associated autophagy-related key regulator n=2 Tax=Panagrolaimus sp. JU765 TaxID=591449 RepID=A0AC34QAB4_9BILA